MGDTTTTNAVLIRSICELLTSNRGDEAEDLLNKQWAFSAFKNKIKQPTPQQTVRVFIRDSFTCLYCGKKLVIPPVMAIISKFMPNSFPYHPNWKYDETHEAVWELSTGCDHKLAVVRGGKTIDDNLVTSCPRCNASKANWTLQELGWKIKKPVDRDWDGLSEQFIKLYRTIDEKFRTQNMSNYYNALKKNNYPPNAWK